MKTQRAFESSVESRSGSPDDLTRYRIPRADIADLLRGGSIQQESPSRLIRLGRTLWRACAAPVTTLRVWQERASSRKRLADLDPRMLRDIGVSRIEVWRESGKPFWQE